MLRSNERSQPNYITVKEGERLALKESCKCAHFPLAVHACYKTMITELNDPRMPLIQQYAPPPKRARQMDIVGPCFFGHTYTSTVCHDGTPRWHPVPQGITWRGATPGSVLCGTCYTGMNRYRRLGTRPDDFTHHSDDDEVPNSDANQTRPMIMQPPDTPTQHTIDEIHIEDVDTPTKNARARKCSILV